MPRSSPKVLWRSVPRAGLTGPGVRRIVWEVHGRYDREEEAARLTMTRSSCGRLLRGGTERAGPRVDVVGDRVAAADAVLSRRCAGSRVAGRGILMAPRRGRGEGRLGDALDGSARLLGGGRPPSARDTVSLSSAHRTVAPTSSSELRPSCLPQSLLLELPKRAGPFDRELHALIGRRR